MSEDVQTLLKDADKARSQRNWDEAIEKYKSIIEADPNNEEAYSKLAELFAVRGLISSVVEQYFSLMDVLENKEEYDLAVEVAHWIMKLQPENDKARMKTILIYIKKNDIEEVVKQSLHLARFYIELGQGDQSILLLKNAQEIAPDNLEIGLELAEMYVSHGHIQEGTNQYRKIASAYLENNNYEKAAEAFRRMKVVVTDDLELLFTLGNVYMHLGKYDDAEAEFRAILRHNLNHTEALMALGHVCQKKGQFRDAILAFNKILSVEPQNEGAKEKLGELYQAQGATGEAVKHYLQAASTYQFNEDVDKAIRLYQRVLTIDPTNPTACRELTNLGAPLVAEEPDPGLAVTPVNLKGGDSLGIPPSLDELTGTIMPREGEMPGDQMSDDEGEDESSGEPSRGFRRKGGGEKIGGGLIRKGGLGGAKKMGGSKLGGQRPGLLSKRDQTKKSGLISKKPGEAGILSKKHLGKTDKLFETKEDHDDDFPDTSTQSEEIELEVEIFEETEVEVFESPGTEPESEPEPEPELEEFNDNIEVPEEDKEAEGFDKSEGFDEQIDLESESEDFPMLENDQPEEKDIDEFATLDDSESDVLPENLEIESDLSAVDLPDEIPEMNEEQLTMDEDFNPAPLSDFELQSEEIQEAEQKLVVESLKDTVDMDENVEFDFESMETDSDASVAHEIEEGIRIVEIPEAESLMPESDFSIGAVEPESQIDVQEDVSEESAGLLRKTKKPLKKSLLGKSKKSIEVDHSFSDEPLMTESVDDIMVEPLEAASEDEIPALESIEVDESSFQDEIPGFDDLFEDKDSSESEELFEPGELPEIDDVSQPPEGSELQEFDALPELSDIPEVSDFGEATEEPGSEQMSDTEELFIEELFSEEALSDIPENIQQKAGESGNLADDFSAGFEFDVLPDVTDPESTDKIDDIPVFEDIQDAPDMQNISPFDEAIPGDLKQEVAGDDLDFSGEFDLSLPDVEKIDENIGQFNEFEVDMNKAESEPADLLGELFENTAEDLSFDVPDEKSEVLDDKPSLSNEASLNEASLDDEDIGTGPPTDLPLFSSAELPELSNVPEFDDIPSETSLIELETVTDSIFELSDTGLFSQDSAVLPALDTSGISQTEESVFGSSFDDLLKLAEEIENILPDEDSLSRIDSETSKDIGQENPELDELQLSGESEVSGSMSTSFLSDDWIAGDPAAVKTREIDLSAMDALVSGEQDAKSVSTSFLSYADVPEDESGFEGTNILDSSFVAEGGMTTDLEGAEEAATPAAEPEIDIMEKVMSILREGDYGIALPQLEELLDRYPEDYQLRKEYADICFDFGLLDQAVESYRLILDKEPKNYEIRRKVIKSHLVHDNIENAVTSLVEYGVCLTEDNHVDDAQRVFQHALALDKENSKAREVLSEIYLNLEMKQLALYHLNILAEYLEQQSSIEETIKVLKKIFSLTSDLNSQEKLTSVYIEHGYTADAIVELQSLAERYWERGEYTKAATNYEKVVELDSRHVESHNKLIELYSHLGENERSYKEKVIVADLLLSKEKFNEARIRFEDCLKSKNYDHDIRRKLVDIYIKQDNIERALEEAKVLSEVYHKERRYDEAITMYLQLISYSPQNLSLKERLSEFYVMSDHVVKGLEQLMIVAEKHEYDKDWDDAIRVYRKMAAIDGTQVDLHFRLGEIFLKYKNNKNDARYEFEKVLETDGAHRKAMDYLVDLYLDADKPAESIQILSKLMEIDNSYTSKKNRIINDYVARVKDNPNDYKLNFDLGIIYKELEMWKQAIEQFQVTRKSNEYVLDSHTMLGVCFAQQPPMINLAVKTLEKGLELKGFPERKYLELHYHLGVLYERLGKVKNAINEYKEVIAIDSHYRDTAELLKNLKEKSK
jgi:tetratricopeptide (TPR) repeat protein